MSRRRWWRRNWPVVTLALAAVVVAVLASLATARGGDRPLDPRSPTPQGARAVASVLADQGIEVRRLDRLDDLVAGAAPGTTLVMVDTGVPLPVDRLGELARSGADLVLVDPGFLLLDELAPEVVQAGPSEDDGAADPTCTHPDAQAAGPVSGGGSRYAADESGGGRPAVVCYPQGDGDQRGTYAVVGTPGEGLVTVIGAPAILTNESLAAQGNAALALRTLGRQPTVLWYLPDPLDPALARPDDEVDPLSLLPRWVDWVALQLLVVTVVAIVWRFRRLGRLVPERLPAVVRSVETAEGRARLYRRSGARDAAAALLRADAAHDLGARLGAPRGARPDEVAALVATASGRSPAQVSDLLAGPAPADDTALARLASELDDLAGSVRTPSQRSHSHQEGPRQ